MIEIINKDKLPDKWIMSEIRDAEKENNRHCAKAEFILLENGDVKEKFYWQQVNFERIRRITGYLVGTVERFNNGKRAEEHDRVNHL